MQTRENYTNGRQKSTPSHLIANLEPNFKKWCWCHISFSSIWNWWFNSHSVEMNEIVLGSFSSGQIRQRKSKTIFNRLQSFIVLTWWTFTAVDHLTKKKNLCHCKHGQTTTPQDLTFDCMCPAHLGHPGHHLSAGLHLNLNQDIHLFPFPYSQGQHEAATKPDGENEGRNWEKGDKELKLTPCRWSVPPKAWTNSSDRYNLIST